MPLAVVRQCLHCQIYCLWLWENIVTLGVKLLLESEWNKFYKNVQYS